MKPNHKLALGVLAGVVMGIAGTSAMHARQMKTAPGYMIAEVDVHDPETFQQYSKQVPDTLKPYGGRYVVRGGKIEAVEGQAPQRFVIVEFDSVEKALAWENSPEYSAIKPIRHKSATSRVFIAPGVPQP